MWQVRIDDVPLIPKAGLLHDPPRGGVRRQREGDELGPVQLHKADAHALPREFRGQAPPPELRQETVADLDLPSAFHRRMSQASASGKMPRMRVARRPPAE